MKQSSRESVKKLCIQAVLIALFFVLDFLSIKAGNIKITFGGLPVILASVLFDPVSGLCVGLIGSFLGQLVTYGLSVTTPLWILPAGIRGLSMGLIYKAFGKKEKWGILLGEIVITSLLVTVLNTVVNYIDSLIFHYPYALVLGESVFRLISSVLTAVIYALVLPLVLKAARKIVK